MHHSSIVPAADVHTAWCKCRDCSQHDPIAHYRRSRIVRLQAGVLIGALVIFYLFAASNWHGIADAFGTAL